MTVLATTGLFAGHGGRPLLGPLDLAIPSGRFVCLLGANGAGKSTLIRTLCAMQAPVAGQVHLDGEPIHAMSAAQRARRLAVVLTERVDGTLMRGYELASMGRYPYLGWAGRLSADDHRIVHQALSSAGALSLADRLVAELSDGERQKIMIARALAQQPRLLVLDEATAFLDLPRRVGTMQLLLDLAHRNGLAVLLSTHDLELALRYADELWLIDGQRSMHVGAPEDLAIDGVLGTSFAADGLTFDLERAELRVGPAGRSAIRVEGGGLRASWAARALERAGFVHDPAAALTLRADASGYTVVGSDGVATCHSTLGALVEALRSASNGTAIAQGRP
ncbi:ABC-type cobalamin/Fe3+-siderophores transport systems, ATPase component [Cupriavidus gilardii CR3]|uniref:ABC transporter ATP-binding protein n=1 Tax=Cupriavidus gilardii TaxID=82541 RepID=A0A849BJE2_9BURK|nr:ABC transporter ATP-binding protein [Cupriavidus gilardii]ALD93103.1 ABC-type cobalamin/Fe3+-siderophores transport systems, ATPase component [Cupriavidus gilardii CR3]KAB0599482.1 ABC transporter ATP-binding protein [Cupriavidus gilardii]MCT9013012.1 ABC transporter ATP-binding protein [Cupriavidus gilardii]MCT9052566.1 ABC transporter ATP-binding protein [Cupriavidus gilardii]NNH10739.1 ABC transporter ATP-binding protein [Cupriavidus gilardii]